MPSLAWARLRGLLQKGEAPPLLLFFGDSEFLIERALQAVASLVPAEERPVCLWRGAASEVDPDRLLDEAGTLPMFGGRRVVIVREAEKFPAASHAGWRAYLTRPAPSTVVAFAATAGADTRNLQALRQACAVTELRTPAARALPGWIADAARARGCALEPGAAEWMAEVGGRDLAALDAWLERAILLRGEPGPLARQDLDAVSGRRAPASLFQWADRLGEGRTAEALILAAAALEDGEQPLALLARGAGHLRRLAVVRAALDAGASPAEAVRRAGAPSFLAGSLAEQARGRAAAGLRAALASCAVADRRLKSWRVSGERILDRWILGCRR
jgi:DNA polymerase-3 subunit delta